MKKDLFLKVIGVLYLIWGVASVMNTIFGNTGLAPILWMSYIGMFLLGIGILRRDSFLIASQINILAIPYLLWTIDFFYALINGVTLFNIVDYFFVPGPLIGKIIGLQHLVTIPISLYAIYLIGLKRKDAWKLSFVQLVIVFFATLLLTSPDSNVNCVFETCTNFDFGVYYPLEWFVSYFLMVLITGFLVGWVGGKR